MEIKKVNGFPILTGEKINDFAFSKDEFTNKKYTNKLINDQAVIHTDESLEIDMPSQSVNLKQDKKFKHIRVGSLGSTKSASKALDGGTNDQDKIQKSAQ